MGIGPCAATEVFMVAARVIITESFTTTVSARSE